MLQELPKKEKNYATPTQGQLFWRVQGECWRRAVTPFLMYLFMSMIALTMQAISGDKLLWLRMLLGIVCILCGAAYNAHLCFQYGKKHYDVFATGEIHRRNAAFGIESGGDYRAHQEYRPWKGFLIGFFTGVPAVLFGLISAFTGALDFVYLLLAGWAYLPLSWARSIKVQRLGEGATINGAWSIFMVLLPVLVSGVFYILGAKKRKAEKDAASARAAEVERLRQEAKKNQEERRIQTEEQRKKTAQSKKKKK